jgi:hypothetical protein
MYSSPIEVLRAASPSKIRDYSILDEPGGKMSADEYKAMIELAKNAIPTNVKCVGLNKNNDTPNSYQFCSCFELILLVSNFFFLKKIKRFPLQSKKFQYI